MSDLKRLVLDKLLPISEIVSKVEDDEIDELVLSGLGITDETLPLEIFNLDLISLDLSNNQLTKLPNAIAKMNMLEKLNISDNSIYSLPRDFSRLTALKKIELSGNKFSAEVEAIAKCWLKREESLDLSKRDLRHLCPEIRLCCDHLRELILDDNNLSALPEDIGLLTKLERLSVQRNSLAALDWEISQCSKLVSLDLSGNKVRRVAPETTALVDLVELFLSSNELGTVPPALFSLGNLEILTLSKNGISSIPSLIFNLHRLKQLDLSNNQISIIPREVCMLPKLKKLNLKNNRVSEIPIFISELGALTELDLTNNELSYIYNDLGALASLTTLKLGNNRLAEVSSTVGLMSGLQKLVLKGNERLRSPAPDVAKQGTAKVMEALSKSAGKRFVRDEFMRLVVVGDPGVGKSCLLSCLRTQSPDTSAPRAGKYGLALDDWTLVIVDEKTDDETLIKFETWDMTTPRELMEASRTFFTNRTIFIVACKVEDTNVMHWLDLIRSKVSDPSIFVVATHCDSSSSDENVKMMANRYSGDVVGTFGVSCKKGTNIQRLVAAITKHCLHNRFFISAYIPAKYRSVDARVASFKFPFITVAELEKHLEDCQIQKPAQLLRCQRYLKDHAKIISYPDAADKDILICNSLWFYDHLMKLLLLGKPTLEKDELSKVLGDERKKMIKALRQLYIAVEKDHHTLFIPSLVSESERASRLEKTQIKVSDWRKDAVLRNWYIFRDHIPAGFFRQFAMRLHAHAYVSGFEGYDEFSVSSTDGSPIVAFVACPSQTEIEILFHWEGGPIAKRPPWDELQGPCNQLSELIYRHFSDTCYDWLFYPLSFSLDDVPIRGDGAPTPAVNPLAVSKKRSKSSIKSLDDSAESNASQSSPRAGKSADSTDGASNSAAVAGASVVSATPSQQLMAPTGVAFTSKELHAEDTRRRYHYRYFRNEMRFLMVNPGLDLPSFSKSALGTLRPVSDAFGNRVQRSCYLKRAVVVTTLAEDSMDFVSACSDPNFGLIQLQHKNIIVPVAVDVEEQAVMMPDISDINLATLIRTQPNELVRANYLKILIDIGEGIAALHSAKPHICAQQLSSSNIVVRKGPGGMYKAAICSFGVLSPRSTKLNRDNRDQNIYAFGVIMAELLAKVVVTDPLVDGVKVPEPPTNSPAPLMALIERCTGDSSATARPAIEDVLRELYKLAVVTSSQLRSAVQQELEYASTHLIVSRIGVVPMVRFLQDKALRDHFFEFLCKEYSQENLLFYEAVQEYKRSRTKKRAYIATQIQKELFSKINSTEALMGPVNKKIQAGEFPVEMFDAIEREIVMLMENDTYKRYLAQRAKK